MSEELGIIFDFNGVIVDDYPIQKEAWDILSLQLREHICTDQEMLNNVRGIPTRDIVKWMSQNCWKWKAVSSTGTNARCKIRD